MSQRQQNLRVTLGKARPDRKQMLEDAEPKSDPELRTSIAHTNIRTLLVTVQELVKFRHDLMIREQESIETSTGGQLFTSCHRR